MGGAKEMFLGLILFKMLLHNILRKYRIFFNSEGVDFCEKRGVVGPFCGAFFGHREKKFDFFTAVLQAVELKREGKVKKNFGGLENVRIFAPAFERGRRPEGVPEQEGRRE